MFLYAVQVVVAHRDDLSGINLPAPYELYPYLFFDSKTINEAQTKTLPVTIPGVKVPSSAYLVYANYSSAYGMLNDETKLSYFTEDIGWNSYYFYFHIDYPFWMNGTEFGLNKDRRGEQFLYMHQQLLARYYLERLSNRMREIPEFQWTQPIETGYDPHMHYYNGVSFASRKNFYDLSATEEYDTLDLIDDYERRIRDLIDFGYYTTRDGVRIDMRQPESVEYLGNIIQTNPDSVDTRFFGYYLLLSHKLLGGSTLDYASNYKIIPSVLEHFETAMRDPVFYQLYKRVVKYFYRFKKFLTPYQSTELSLPGVTINNVTVGKLTTFFEYYDSDITTVAESIPLPNMTAYISSIGTKKTKKVPKPPKTISISARQIRLNHKPFVLSVNITSDKPQKVVFRTYLGPKYDTDGNVLSLNDNRDNFVELDQFQYDLPAGLISIVRNSKDFCYTAKDKTSYTELYRKVMLALEGIVPIFLDNSEAHCGFVDRLILPKGWIEGLPMQLFVMVSPYVAPEKPQFSTYDPTVSCGIGSGSRFVDKLPFGYPFDREIDEDQFKVPNLFFTDVLIYHKSTTLDALLYQ